MQYREELNYTPSMKKTSYLPKQSMQDFCITCDKIDYVKVVLQKIFVLSQRRENRNTFFWMQKILLYLLVQIKAKSMK